MTHPFEHLSAKHLRGAALWLLAATAFLTGVMVSAIPIKDFGHIMRLGSAGSAALATEVLASWPPSTFRSATFLFGFDFLYDVVHNNAAALLCLWGASLHGASWTRALARVVAWAMWLCTVLNLPENLIFLETVRSTPAAPWFSLALTIAAFRAIALWSSFVLGALLVAWGTWRSPNFRAD